MCPKVEDEMKAQPFLAVWAFTTLCLVSYTAAFSHGASLSACTDMRPKHIRAHLQNPQNNYITIHTNMSFFPGGRVPVTVRSTRDFMGFMLQARRVSNDQIAGTFVYIPPGSKLLTCFEDGDTVTHSDKSLKRNLSFVWKASDQPIGDIRFFLSVVQSYFVYWAKIGSSTLSQQMQNRTTTESTVDSSAIKPTPLQEPSDPKEAFMASEDLVTSHVIAHGRGRQANSSDMDSGFRLESSLHFQDLSVTTQDDSSSYSTHNRTESASSIPVSLLASTCKKGMEEVSATFNPGISKSAPPIASSVLVQLWNSSLLSAENSDHEEDTNVYQSLTASQQIMEKQPVTQKAPAKFLPEAELTAPGQEEKGGKDVPGNTLLKVTRALPKVAVSREGGGKLHKGSQLMAAQFGVLLGCSVVLGMVVAIGLRCIHSQYCHRRTEVSFSEPDNNVIALQDSGEMMHFRKIRENSFVLVQAEYNWISPPGSGKKAAL
ncbi:reelin domain-containing protein 1 isoform X2 [Varanus komodoensis]|uniref:reelin domain-containing protein 1 isoform X2 n=1 Tax=Varanus komodoensis TaxID=61221 RepID=UPI001CF7A549|nr:reelin domain-containing protein 1 isoform X2 [Varanus komodoensis]